MQSVWQIICNPTHWHICNQIIIAVLIIVINILPQVYDLSVTNMTCIAIFFRSPLNIITVSVMYTIVIISKKIHGK